MGQNIAEIALAHTVKEIQALLSFTILSKIGKFKMAAIFGEKGKFFKLDKVLKETLWVQNSLEIALSLTVFKIFAIFCFPQKFKMAAKN